MAVVAHLAALLATTKDSPVLRSETLTADVALDPSQPAQDLVFTTTAPAESTAFLTVRLIVVHDGEEDGTVAVVPVEDGVEGAAWYEHTFAGDIERHALSAGPDQPIDAERTERHLRLTYEGTGSVEGTVELSVWANGMGTERETRRADPPEIAWE